MELEVTGKKVKDLPFHELVKLIKEVDQGIEVKIGEQGRRFVVLPRGNRANDLIDALAEKGVDVVKLKRH